ncbi:hypothetical protein V1509DRAFT_616729 [Lipomyces kononenkoae]
MDAIPRLASSRTPAATDTYTPTRPSSSSTAVPQFGLNSGHLLRLQESRPSPLLYSRSHTTSPLNSPYVLSPRVPASLRNNRFKNLFSTSESPSRDERASEDGFKSWVDGLKSKAKRALHENEKSEIEFAGWIESEERRQRTMFEIPASILAGDDDEDQDTVQSVAFETLGHILLEEKQKRERDIAEERAAKKRRQMQDKDDVMPNMKSIPKMSAPLPDNGIRRSPMRIYEDSQSRSGSEYNGYGGSLQSEDEYGEVYADENVDPHHVLDMVADVDADGDIESNENDAGSAGEDHELLAQPQGLSEADSSSKYDYEQDQNEPAGPSLHDEQRETTHGLDLFSTALAIDPALFSAADSILADSRKTEVEEEQSDQKVEHIEDKLYQADASDENEFVDDGVDEKSVRDGEYDDQEEYDDDDQYDEYDDYDYDEEYDQYQESGYMPQLDGKSKQLSTENHPYSSPPASDLADEEYESGEEPEASAIEPRKKKEQSDVIQLSSDESGESQANVSSPSLSSESGPDEDSEIEPDELVEETSESKWTPTIPFTKPTRVLNDIIQRNRTNVNAYAHNDSQSSDDGQYDQYTQDEDQYSENFEYDDEDIQNNDPPSGEECDEMSVSESEQSFQQTFQDDDDPDEERVSALEERRKELATEEADQEMADVEDNSQADTEIDTKTKTTPTVSEITEESESAPDDGEVFIEEEAQTPLVHESDSDPNERFLEEDDYWEGRDDIPGPESMADEHPPEFERAPNEYRIETRKHSTFTLGEEDRKELVTETALEDVSLQANAQESK